MKTTLQDELWQKIEAFVLDDPYSNFPFSKKLEKENNWSPGFAARAIEEYRKFIYLCCIAPTGASPSDAVDKVWHLHLTYTQNYWISFCKKTLHKDIHHHPSKGGSSENDKHVNWYKQTLQLYEEVFETAPPLSIWPQNNIFPEHIDTLLYNKNLFNNVAVAFCLTTLLYIFTTSLFKTNGPDFLLYYALLCIAGLVVSFLLSMQKEEQLEKIVEENYPASFNTFQATHFIYGPHKSYQTALIDLLKRGIIDCSKNNFRFNGYQKEDTLEEINPLIKPLSEKVNVGVDFTYPEGLALMDNDLVTQPAFDKLTLLSKKVDYQKFVVPGIVLLIGFARLFQGMANYKPVSYLVLEIGIFCVFSLMIAQQYSCNYLVFVIAEKIWKKQNYDGKGNNILNNFSILGATVIAGFAEYPILAAMFTYYLPPAQNILGNATGSSSGCSSGSSCSVGSSCCGGGCGGGGGGD